MNFKTRIQQMRDRYNKNLELKKILELKGRVGSEYCTCGGCMFALGDMLKCGDCGRTIGGSHVDKKK